MSDSKSDGPYLDDELPGNRQSRENLLELQARLASSARKEYARRGRIRSRRPISCSRYEPSSEHPVDHLALPGTLTIMLSDKDSDLLRRIRKSVEEHSDDDVVCKREIVSQFSPPRVLPRSVAELMAENSRELVSIEYKGKPIAADLFLPDDAPILYLVLEYTGGEIDLDAFSMTVDSRPDAPDRLDGLILLNGPELEAWEKEALSRIPTELSELHIAGIGTAAVIWYVAFVAAAAVAFMTATAACSDRNLQAHLPRAFFMTLWRPCSRNDGRSCGIRWG